MLLMLFFDNVAMEMENTMEMYTITSTDSMLLPTYSKSSCKSFQKFSHTHKWKSGKIRKKKAFACVLCKYFPYQTMSKNREKKKVICWCWKIAMENGRLSVHSFFVCCVLFDVMYL